jgi:hypothetical protein
MRKPYRTLLILSVVLACTAISCVFEVKTHPDVFNESFIGHCYCIRGGWSILLSYASEHTNSLPYDDRGYADAILQLGDEAQSWAFSGPGYDPNVYEHGKQFTNMPEELVGRVYVQGLSMTNNPEIVLLFDKHPTAGGSHCHFLSKLSAPLGREVVYLGGGAPFIKETEWNTFCTNQVQLLVREGFTPEKARQMLALDERKQTKSR